MLPDEILLKVLKPARYIGNEINMVVKNPEKTDIRFAFCFPDVYEVGMSHLGLQILYYLLNSREDTYCERVFSPWGDMEQALRGAGLPLGTLETGDALSAFDFLGFTLQYEMSYTNLVNILNLGGIPIYSRERGEDMPIVCAGGPCAYNPEPLADIVDFFFIGEAEAGLDEILNRYREHKSGGGKRAEFLAKILDIDGVYVPKFYEPRYGNDGCLSAFEPTHQDAPRKVKRAFVSDLDQNPFPSKQLVPLIEVIHDRVTLEVFRGCMRGCRFCQAGYVYRPMREKRAETLLSQADALIKSSGHEEISLVSLSTGDYGEFKALAEGLIDAHSKDHVNLSLPSLRIDAFSLELMEKVQEVRRSSLTFAPEAGTQRMRDVINKNLTEQEILDGCSLAYKGGWNRVKLYFMVGLPTEGNEDLLGIVRLSESIVEQHYRNGKHSRPVNVVVSTSCFVPKPFTPFQWEQQDSCESFMDKQRLIKKTFTKKQIKYTYHNAQLSVLESAMARGDRRVGQAIVRAFELGARFDGWTEHFNYEIWTQAFEDCGLELEFFAGRMRAADELLPWDHIDIGISKEFLLRERERALGGQITPNCRELCAGCGVRKAGVCVEQK